MYALCGLGSFIQYSFSNLQTFILPIGIFMGIFHLNLNLRLGRSPDLLANAFVCIAAILCYAFSGFITGVALTLCFNLIAERTRGIDAKFVDVTGGIE